MTFLPADVISDILARLPVEDLLRFGCLSKFFKSLIHGIDFAKLHLSHSQKTNTNLFGVDSLLRFREPQFVVIDVSKSFDEVSAVTVNRLTGFNPAQLWEVLGSCNGLIALKNTKTKGDSIFLIWNPLTGKVTSFLDPHASFPVSYGFGYDPKTDDYKLVKIAEYRHSETPGDSTLKTTVYSLKTNSWKEIGAAWPVYRGYGSCPRKVGILANDALHWEVFEQEEIKIVAFDLINEEFHYVPVSGCFQFDKWFKLSVLDGCLAVTCRFKKHNYVYVMKEYGVKESWIKVLSYLRSMLKCSDNIYPVAFSTRRDKLLLSCSSSWYWYDLLSENFEPCLSRNCDLGILQVIIFTGSLMALDDSIDVADLKRKQSAMEYNEENKEKKRRKRK